MSIYKIYALKEVSSSEIKYIGLTTKSLNERLGRHLRDKKIDHKTNWIKKIGRENIEIILLDDDINNFEELCEKEIYYIDKFKKEGHCLTNITNGGEGWFGIKFSESHRNNISINHADVSGIKNPMYGKSHSKETISKIKENQKSWIENVGYSKEQIFKMKERSSGSNNSNSKLTESIVREIRILFNTGNYSKIKLSNMFGVKPPAIYKIVNKLTWKNI